MSFQFTDEQMARIDRLAAGTDESEFNNAAFPISGVYDYILHLISRNNDPSQGAADRIDPGVWQWFRASGQINRGEGVFSTFIREYTAEQSRLRLGVTPTADTLQEASDLVGERAVDSIKRNTNRLIDLGTIAREDAGAIGEVIYGDEERNAGWSGNLLFPLLGNPTPFRDDITERPDDAYDFFALIRSTQRALTAALGEPVTDIATAFETVWRLAFGEDATLDTSILGNVLEEALDFFEGAYGEGFIAPIIVPALPLVAGAAGASVGFTLSNSYVFNDVVLGRESDVDEVLRATNADNLIHGFGGDDTIIASDASLADNPLFDSDLIDGGAGTDTVSYANTDAIEVSFDQRETLADFVATVGKSNTLAEDILFNVEKIIGSKHDDEFDGDASGLSEGFIIDAGRGDDDVEIEGGNQITVIGGAGNDSISVEGGIGGEVVGGEGRDLLRITSKGGKLFGDGKDQTGRGEGDLFWWSAGTFIMDATEDDKLLYHGIVLTGGTTISWWGGSQEKQVARAWTSVPWVTFATAGEGSQRQLLVDGSLTKDLDPSQSSEEVLAIAQVVEGWSDGDLGITFTTLNVKDEISNLIGLFAIVANAAKAYVAFVKAQLWQPLDDPLVLDLNGDGLVSKGIGAVYWDNDGDLFGEQSGWLSGDDGFLVHDANRDGQITAPELFGGPGLSGYDELSDWDTNADGIVDARVAGAARASARKEPANDNNVSAWRVAAFNLEMVA